VSQPPSMPSSSGRVVEAELNAIANIETADSLYQYLLPCATRLVPVLCNILAPGTMVEWEISETIDSDVQHNTIDPSN
jgi:hypothetical protein